MKEVDYFEFKKAYEKAVEDKLEVFIYDGVEFVTNYAKYMLEYINIKYKFEK